MIVEKLEIEEEYILKIIAMISLALESIHQQGIAHKYLKTKNILVSSIGSYEMYMLTNFGVPMH